MRPTRQLILGVGAAAVLATGCNSAGGSHSSPTVERPTLGPPVASRIPPAVVPSNATLDATAPLGDNAAEYFMPAGLNLSDVETWYGQHMAAGADFQGLRWLERVLGVSSNPDWYWCASRGKTLDVAMDQNDAGADSHAGQSFVIIAIQPDTIDNTCG